MVSINLSLFFHDILAAVCGDCRLAVPAPIGLGRTYYAAAVVHHEAVQSAPEVSIGELGAFSQSFLPAGPAGVKSSKVVGPPEQASCSAFRKPRLADPATMTQQGWR